MLFSFILLTLFLFFWLYIVDINVFCNLCVRFDRKKIEQVCERHYFQGHIHTVYKISGLKNHKKVVVVVNCRSKYKLEYYQIVKQLKAPK